MSYKLFSPDITINYTRRYLKDLSLSFLGLMPIMEIL